MPDKKFAVLAAITINTMDEEKNDTSLWAGGIVLCRGSRHAGLSKTVDIGKKKSRSVKTDRLFLCTYSPFATSSR